MIAPVAASLGARARQGGSALARPFTGYNLDVTTGPTGTLTPLGETSAARFYLGSSESSQSAYLGTTLSGKLIRFADVEAHQLDLYPNGAQITNIDTDVQVYNYSSNSASISSLTNSRVSTDITAQNLSGTITAAVDMGGLIKNVDFTGTSQDGLFPGYNLSRDGVVGRWTVCEGLNVVGLGAFNYYGGYPYGLTPDQDGTPTTGGTSGGSYPYTSGVPNTGSLLTKTQIDDATEWVASSPGSGQVGPGSAVVNGQLITTNTPNGWLAYQVVTAGNLGSENPTTGAWFDSTANLLSSPGSTQTAPFTSGTAELFLAAAALHSDAFQTTGRQCVAIRNCYGADFANSCALIQNYAENTNPTPVMNWVIEHSRFRPAGNYAFYVQSQTPDANYSYSGTASHNQQGGFTRVSSTDWTIASNPGNSRPWHVTFQDNDIETPLYGPNAGVLCTIAQCMSGNGVVYVDSVARRIVLMAAQFGWDATDQRLWMMEAGTYDCVDAGFPPPVPSVMEARLQAAITAMTGSGGGYSGGTSIGFSATPGALDARCMVVWKRNIRNQNGAPIYPSSGVTPASTAITDAQSYYIGE